MNTIITFINTYNTEIVVFAALFVAITAVILWIADMSFGSNIKSVLITAFIIIFVVSIVTGVSTFFTSACKYCGDTYISFSQAVCEGCRIN